jgi:hypothetical protein
VGNIKIKFSFCIGGGGNSSSLEGNRYRTPLSSVTMPFIGVAANELMEELIVRITRQIFSS